MCGRKTLTKDKTEIIKEYLQDETQAKFDWTPSYNIAPGQTTPILTYQNQRKILSMQWGLIPHWAQDKKIGYKMINARSETLDKKKSYAPLLKHNRCIVITDGYYEWKKQSSGKQPYFIYRNNQDFMPMAGLWSQWKSPRGKTINTYTVITTTPQQNIAHIHNRMPVILNAGTIDQWLKADKKNSQDLLIPYQEDLNYYPVTPKMNKPMYNSPKCLERYSPDSLTLF